MSASRAAGASFLAAAILASVTLFVFYTLRDYGPASAVRRFHDDFRTGNFSDLQRITVQDIQKSDSVKTLGRFILNIDQLNAQPKFEGMDRSPGQVDLLVIYQFPDHTEPLVWVVVHDNQLSWQVDAVQTLRASAAITRGITPF